MGAELKEKQSGTDKGDYPHYMLKEVYEQPAVVMETLRGRVDGERVLDEAFGPSASEVFDSVRAVHIVACGTSYHAGLVARYWIEGLAGIPCTVEIASEFRYRRAIVHPDTLLVTISQSGETADTLGALRHARQGAYKATLAVCNVPGSSLVEESDLVLLTRAGPEIGVASTKAFTAQLVSLLLLTLSLSRRNGLTRDQEAEVVAALQQLPQQIAATLTLDEAIKEMSQHFSGAQHALFLGRGLQWPIAMEGALKMKEISYIHAEAYPAGELKHGPLALVDQEMPVVMVVPDDAMVERMQAAMDEVKMRGGPLFVFADQAIELNGGERVYRVPVPPVSQVLAPIVYAIPLQLLAYHVAVMKGTDVDQPRNLTKAVTVE